MGVAVAQAVPAKPLSFRRSTDTYALHPFNPLKLLVHADRVRALVRGELVYPVSVELDLSLKCNHACEWCSFDGWRHANWIDFPAPRVLSLLHELKDVGVLAVTLTGGGEPLVHKQAPEVMRTLTDLGIQWGVVTNGFMVRGERAELMAAHATFVRVSLDAGTTETHQRLHQAPHPQYEQILRNMARLRERAGRRLTIGASMCIFDSNVQEIQLAAQRLKEIGADYVEVRPVYPTTWRGGRQDDSGLSDSNVDEAKGNIVAAKHLYEDETFRVIGMVDRFDAVQAFRHRDFYDKCRITHLSTVISSDGHVYACCVHRGLKAFSAGSVLSKSFREVWDSEQHEQMVESIDIDRCPKCRYVGLNSAIQHAFVKDGMHANFI